MMTFLNIVTPNGLHASFDVTGRQMKGVSITEESENEMFIIPTVLVGSDLSEMISHVPRLYQ